MKLCRLFVDPGHGTVIGRARLLLAPAPPPGACVRPLALCAVG